jgi:4-amino-4-deoxy-L-arabinose transferase-like glycosyltransferase
MRDSKAALPEWLGQSRRCLPFVALIWACFLARGLFYCSFLPLWEGYDEWAHFSYVERLVTADDVLVGRDAPVSREVEASLQFAPLPWGMSSRPKPSLTEDDYWWLPPEERAKLQRQLTAMPASWSNQPASHGLPIYEALQPPLYYWLLSLPYRLVRHTSLAEKVFFLRYVSMAIASFAIPLVFLVTWGVVGNSAAALCAAALLSVMPEFMVNVCRVGNDCLAVVLYSWLILLCLRLARDIVPRKTGISIGIALGLGLLAKAYFLTAIPALAVLYLWRIWRAKEKRAWIYQAVATCGASLLIAGWWYIRNRVTTGAWSGLSESVMLRHGTWRQFLEGIGRVPWLKAVDSILVSHIWFGGWSSLTVRSWMYHALFLVAAFAIAGVTSTFWRRAEVRRSSLYPLLALYGFFWLGQFYNVLLLFLSKGVSASMGWYMYCVIAAEISLLIVGLQSLTPLSGWAWMLATLVLCLAALDVYTVHFVSIPYYTGLIAHRPNGFLAAFSLGRMRQVGLREVLYRLCVNKPLWLTPVTLGVLWTCYAAATAILIGLPFWAAAKSASRRHPGTSTRPDSLRAPQLRSSRGRPQ